MRRKPGRPAEFVPLWAVADRLAAGGTIRGVARDLGIGYGTLHRALGTAAWQTVRQNLRGGVLDHFPTIGRPRVTPEHPPSPPRGRLGRRGRDLPLQQMDQQLGVRQAEPLPQKKLRIVVERA